MTNEMIENNNESNVAVMEHTAQVETKQTKKRDRKAEKSRRTEKLAKKNEAKQAESVVTEASTETQAEVTQSSANETAQVVQNEVKRHKDVAQFEKVALFLLEQDGRKAISVQVIKNALEKQIETYRFAVYLWEMIGKAGAKIEKIREKRTVVAIKLLNRDDVRKYLKSRFPDMKIK